MDNWEHSHMTKMKEKNILKTRQEEVLFPDKSGTRVSGFLMATVHYSGDLKSGHVRISNGQSLSSFLMVRILNGSFSLDCLLTQTKNLFIYKTV